MNAKKTTSVVSTVTATTTAWARQRPATTTVATMAITSATIPPRESVRKVASRHTPAAATRAIRSSGLPFSTTASANAITRPATSTAASWFGSPIVPARRSESTSGGGAIRPYAPDRVEAVTNAPSSQRTCLRRPHGREHDQEEERAQDVAQGDRQAVTRQL